MSLAEALARLEGRLPELPMLNEELFLLGRPPSLEAEDGFWDELE